MTDKEIIAKRLQLLGKHQELKETLENKSKKSTNSIYSDKNKVNKNNESYDCNNNNKTDISTNANNEPYEPELLVDQFEVDTSQMTDNRINNNQSYKNSSYNSNSQSFNDYVYSKYNSFKDCLHKIPRHYYDPYYNSEMPIRIGFYCLCTATILILLIVVYAMF
jgi:hypothetical protein